MISLALVAVLALTVTTDAFHMTTFSHRHLASRSHYHHSFMKMSMVPDDETSVIPVSTELATDPSEGAAAEKTSKALFGMGCFWAPQEEFNKVYGVVSATSGYANIVPGEEPDIPGSYISVCGGDGRTEAVLVEYAPSVISYKQLLQTFWSYHDASVIASKPQYQSVIWPLNEEQRQVAYEEMEKAKDAYKAQGMNTPVTVIAEIPPTTDWVDRAFVMAESIHQNFWTKLRLKVICLACATLFAATDVPMINSVVSDVTLKLVLVWVVWEGIELALSAASSFGLNPLSKQP